MFSHVTIGTNDLTRATAFYDAVFAALGHGSFAIGGNYKGYGAADGDQVWITLPVNGEPATAGNGSMVAFLADTRSSVDDAHGAAMANGGADEGAPGLRPHYHENYYGGYFRDPDGNKICVVCHRPE
ncbi:MAG: VOC family protein [Rhodospirillales bacterium]